MTQLYNQEWSRERRKELRRNSTEAEKVLWDVLRDRRLEGIKFRRQYGVGGYILDFYAARLKFAIEVDGMAHENAEARAYDKIRSEYLHGVGIEVKRFKNYEVLYNISGVRGWIIEAMNARLVQFPSLPRRG